MRNLVQTQGRTPVGMHQGFDVRLSGYIREMLKHDKQVSYYLNSPGGKQELLVTFFAP